MQLAELIESKIYNKENSAVRFESPKHYLQPFLDIVNVPESNLRIQVQSPITNQNEDGSTNTAYPRVLVEARLGVEIPEYDSVIGMIYALDIQHPQISIYAGQNAHACTNLTIFNADLVFQMNLLGNTQHAYQKASFYLENKRKEIEEFKLTQERLILDHYNTEALQTEMGRLLLLTTRKNSKLPSTSISGAARLLQDKESRYFVKPGEPCSKMNLYDAIT